MIACCNLDELEAAYPGIPWREPLDVRALNAPEPPVEALACRVCVALVGLKASDILEAARNGGEMPEGAFASLEGWERHFEEAHS